MTELEKGTVKMVYKFYFCDRAQDWYIALSLNNASKFADDKSLKDNQHMFIKYLNEETGGNFEPVTYKEYMENAEDIGE